MKIVEGSLIILQERSELLKALLMEGIDVANVTRAQQVRVDEIATVGAHGKVLPLVEIFEFGVLDAHDHVLDANAELALFVVAGLVGGAHALLKLESNTSANVIRSFVTVEITADAMSCTMHVVKTSLP